jgi:hypothetical protein
MKQESTKETINVREKGYLIESEELEEIRPWYLESVSGDTDNDGSDRQD